MSTPRSLALLGGPYTGKSTYLGALVDALQMKKLEHLEQEGLPEDARGLQRFAEPLLSGTYPPRTASGERLELVAQLKTTGSFFSPLSFTLRAGDYAGEEVERLFRDRIHGLTPEWQQRAQSDGFLLLIRPSTLPRVPQVQPATALNEFDRWRHLRQETTVSTPAIVTRTAPAAPTNPDAFFGKLQLDEVPPTPSVAPSAPVIVPMSLAIIELLQFIRHVRELAPGERPQGKERFRIAIVVSTWDSVTPAWRKDGPATYLAQHLPLLEDYLWSNFPPDDVFRFGLSATGGDLHDPEYSSQYLDDPSGFVEWQEAGGNIRRSRDIGLPLYWLLFGDRALGAP
jgi:hypothetical protein